MRTPMPINTPFDNALSRPQIEARKMVVTEHAPAAREMRTADNPSGMSAFPGPDRVILPGF